MLFIFSFFDREFLLPVYNQPNNTVTILSRLHTRNVRNSFTEYFLVAYVHIHESTDTRCTQTLPKVYSTEYPNRRCAKREKRRRTSSSREGGRWRKRRWRWVIDFLDVTQRTYTRAFAHHMRGDFPSGSPR